MAFNKQGLKFSEDGDLVTGENGDLKAASPKESFKQVINNRIKTNDPEWFIHPNIGANLEDLIGEPNTKDTAKKGVKKIKQSLSYDGFIPYDAISIRPVPADARSIINFTTINQRVGSSNKVKTTIETNL